MTSVLPDAPPPGAGARRRAGVRRSRRGRRPARGPSPRCRPARSPVARGRGDRGPAQLDPPGRLQPASGVEEGSWLAAEAVASVAEGHLVHGKGVENAPLQRPGPGARVVAARRMVRSRRGPAEGGRRRQAARRAPVRRRLSIHRGVARDSTRRSCESVRTVPAAAPPSGSTSSHRRSSRTRSPAAAWRPGSSRSAHGNGMAIASARSRRSGVRSGAETTASTGSASGRASVASPGQEVAQRETTTVRRPGPARRARLSS